MQRISSLPITITTDHLTRRFGPITAVDQLNLNVPKGSIYGFLGPNGAGKTTTIRMLLGLIRPSQGEVYLCGLPLKRQRMTLLQSVGSLVESPSLYPHLTGYENLELIRRMIGATSRQITRVLKIVHLEDAARRRVGQYSLGMRQRLGLALALLNEPDLLILDEPTNGLDPAGIHEMRELICGMPEEHGITIFLSSHLLNEVEQMATHVGIIQKGQLLFEGALTELQAQLEDHLILGVDQPEKASWILKKAGWSVQSNNGQNGPQHHPRLVVNVNGESDIAMLNAQLVQARVNVYHLHMAQPSLEEIFLNLTA